MNIYEKDESMEELRRKAREKEDNERIKRQKAETRNKIIMRVLGVGALTVAIVYQVTKEPSEQLKDETTIAAPAEQASDHAAALKSNPQDSKFIMDYLNKLPKETPYEIQFGLRDTLDILMKDSEDSPERRAAVLAELNSTSPEEFLLIQHPYIILQELYAESPLYKVLINSTNPRLKPLQDFMKAYPVTKGQEPEKNIRKLTILLEKLMENQAAIPEDLRRVNFTLTRDEIRDKNLFPIALASVLYGNPREQATPTQTSSYLESLRDSKINRQSKRDVFKLA